MVLADPPTTESAGSDGVPATVPTVHPKLSVADAVGGAERTALERVGNHELEP